MNHLLVQWIEDFVSAYPEQQRHHRWQTPLVAFADVSDPLFSQLKEWGQPDHQLPQDLLADAQSLISFFLPFHPSIPAGNRSGRLASKEWGITYIRTNQLIADLNAHLAHRLAEAGFQSAYTRATHDFDKTNLMSFWSHRHVAVIAGLGQLGLNRMLITEKGCCGRIGTMVTSAALMPTLRKDRPACLRRHDGSCGVCVQRCVNGSLKEQSYHRHACYDMCLENAAALADIGLADVCGKCTVGLPCSGTNPVPLKSPSLA